MHMLSKEKAVTTALYLDRTERMALRQRPCIDSILSLFSPFAEYRR
jgi:hypothetical protein